MSTLTSNLEQIYLVKNQIKQVLGTSSDIFTEYPDLIEAAIGQGGGVTPTGSYNITENGNYDVTSYAYAYVAVQQSPDPYDVIKDLANLVDEGEAEYVDLGAISENFISTQVVDGSSVKHRYEYDLHGSINGVGKLFHVVYEGDDIYFGSFLDDNDELYEELYGNIYPIGQGATIEASEDPRTDGYDYLVTVDSFYYENYYGDVINDPQEITENGNVLWDGSPLLKVNVSETLPTVYLSYNFDDQTGEYGSQVQLVRNPAGNYIYNVGTINAGEAPHFRFDVEYNSTVFPINGAIYWDGVDINDSNVQDQGQTQIAQFITDGGEEYVSPDPSISNSLEVPVNDVILSLEPTETNGVMNMNVFVGWIDPTAS